MNWKPAFRVSVDGEDITSVLAPRLMSLSVSDEAGVQSDAVEITLSDTDPFQRLQIPPKGAEITVAIGYGSRLRDMGLFIADSVELSGPPDQMRIRGVASIHGSTTGGKTAITEQKTRSWPQGSTLGDLVATISREHGLSPAVSTSLASVSLPHIDQIDESDINLLTRIARDYDAIAKPGGGKLVMARRGESLTISGSAMPRLTLMPQQVTSWRLQESLREAAGKVVAIWHDLEAAQDVEVEAGDGEPIRRLRERFPTREAAQAAAGAEFRRGNRAGIQFSIEMPGDPDLVAEARIALSGFRPGVDGEWLVTRVRHQLGTGGYRCSVSAEVPE